MLSYYYLREILLGFSFSFIYLFWLHCVHCCMKTFSSCSEQGLLFLVMCGVSLPWHLCCRETGSLAPARAEYRLSGCLAQAPAVVAHGLSCSMACGTLLDQGSNLWPLHWQVDFYPVYHQGRPGFVCLFLLFVISFRIF